MVYNEYASKIALTRKTFQVVRVRVRVRVTVRVRVRVRVRAPGRSCA